MMGVASAIFTSRAKVKGSVRVSTHMEPFENVTTIPSVGVIMPFEKLIETLFVVSLGRMIPTFSHPTDACTTALCSTTVGTNPSKKTQSNAYGIRFSARSNKQVIKAQTVVMILTMLRIAIVRVCKSVMPVRR